jgi:hypothetical protein
LDISWFGGVQGRASEKSQADKSLSCLVGKSRGGKQIVASFSSTDDILPFIAPSVGESHGISSPVVPLVSVVSTDIVLIQSALVGDASKLSFSGL